MGPFGIQGCEFRLRGFGLQFEFRLKKGKFRRLYVAKCFMEMSQDLRQDSLLWAWGSGFFPCYMRRGF